MRIAYVGRFAEGWATERDMATALRRLEHEVVELHEHQADAWSVIVRERFDLILWTTAGDAHPLAGATLRLVDEPVVGYHLDRWWGLRRQREIASDAFFDSACVDLLVTADGGHDEDWKAVGLRHRWLPPAIASEEALEGRYRADLDVDVAFVGSWRRYLPDWPHRRDLVNHLRRWFGDRLGLWPQHAGPVRGPALSDLYASARVVVGDSCLAGAATRYWSDRIPETLGRGGFLLHPAVGGLEEHFKVGEHLATWPAGNWRALREALAFWITADGERRRIRSAARAHVLEHHTYDVRAAELLAICTEEGLTA